MLRWLEYRCIIVASKEEKEATNVDGRHMLNHGKYIYMIQMSPVFMHVALSSRELNDKIILNITA